MNCKKCGDWMHPMYPSDTCKKCSDKMKKIKKRKLSFGPPAPDEIVITIINPKALKIIIKG